MVSVFFSRSQAATAALKKGIKAFRTFRPIPEADKACWTYIEMPNGPGVEYANLFAEDKDWVHHTEITDKAIPVLVVTCFREEIIEKIPELFVIEPITPELWENNRKEYPAPARYLRKPKLNGADDTGGESAPAPVASTERKRNGATGVCREIMSSNPEYKTNKAAFVAACLEQGVILATASTQYYRLK